MNRRLTYVLLIIIIIVLIFNAAVSEVSLYRNVNITLAIGFCTFLIYKHLKFREYDNFLATKSPHEADVLRNSTEIDEGNVEVDEDPALMLEEIRRASRAKNI